MARRYSGQLEIHVAPLRERNGVYRAVVRHGDRVLWYGNVRAADRDGNPLTGSSTRSLDAAAASALAHGEEHAPSITSLSEERDGYYRIRRRAPTTRDPMKLSLRRPRPRRTAKRRDPAAMPPISKDDFVEWLQDEGLPTRFLAGTAFENPRRHASTLLRSPDALTRGQRAILSGIASGETEVY
jgi:hypothetical protein